MFKPEGTATSSHLSRVRGPRSDRRIQRGQPKTPKVMDKVLATGDHFQILFSQQPGTGFPGTVLQLSTRSRPRTAPHSARTTTSGRTNGRST